MHKLAYLNMRPLSSIYMLDTPGFKFVLHSIFNTALIIALALLPTRSRQTEGEDLGAISALWLWTFAALISKVEECARLLTVAFATWTGDPFNYAELLAFALASASLSLRLFAPMVAKLSPALAEWTVALALVPPADSDEPSTRPWHLLSGALVALILAQGLRALMLTSALGHLVLMVPEMVKDMLRWLVLVLVVLIAFATAFYVGFSGLYVAHADASLLADCGGTYTQMGKAYLVWQVVTLFEYDIGLEPDAFVDCMRRAGPIANAAEMTTLTLVYLLLAVVLLVNMLIAMMTKTFEGVYGRQARHRPPATPTLNSSHTSTPLPARR